MIRLTATGKVKAVALAAREQMLYDLLMDGMPQREIATTMGIALSTLSIMIMRIKDKKGFSGTTGAFVKREKERAVAIPPA